MATDATGTPTTPLGIPKYNTAQDIPSGKGFNAAMDYIDDLFLSRAGNLALTDAAATITLGGDTNLYRYAANYLGTDDNFRIVGGTLNLGTDTNLYRSAADTLKTDDRLIVGNNGDPVSGAQLSAVRSGDSIEFGHANSAGYRSTIGCDNGGGTARIAFYGEHGSTNGTYRTRGFRATILAPDSTGGLLIQNVALANADNQTAVTLLQVDKDKIHFMPNNVAGTPGLPSGGGYFYTEAGALKYKGSAGTVTTIAPA